MATIHVRAFLQRHAGSTSVRLWLLPTTRPDVSWFLDMDYSQALRDEAAQSEAQSPGDTGWESFRASFFGPDFQMIEALSGPYDERDLDYEFTRAVPDPGLQAALPAPAGGQSVR